MLTNRRTQTEVKGLGGQELIEFQTRLATLRSLSSHWQALEAKVNLETKVSQETKVNKGSSKK